MGLLRKTRAAAAPPVQRPKPVSCTSCGRTYSSQSAYQVAHEGDRCLPDHMVVGSVLELVDGVYTVLGAQ